MHATNSKEGMFDTSSCDVKITIRDGNSFKAIMKGNKQFILIYLDDKVMTVTFQEVYYITGLYCNLFSVTIAITGRASLEKEGLCLVLTKIKLIDHF